MAYVRQNFWPRVPGAMTLAGLNALVIRWAAERDPRIHGTIFARPVDRWAADLAGATPYDPTRLWAFGEQWDRYRALTHKIFWRRDGCACTSGPTTRGPSSRDAKYELNGCRDCSIIESPKASRRIVTLCVCVADRSSLEACSFQVPKANSHPVCVRGRSV